MSVPAMEEICTEQNYVPSDCLYSFTHVPELTNTLYYSARGYCGLRGCLGQRSPRNCISSRLRGRLGIAVHAGIYYTPRRPGPSLCGAWKALGRRRLADFEDLEREVEGATGRDAPRREASGAVALVARDDHLALLACASIAVGRHACTQHTRPARQDVEQSKILLACAPSFMPSRP